MTGHLKQYLPHRNEKGQSLVELAFGIVILLFLLAGIIDLGRLLFFFIALRDAAQEGAVYGALNPIYCQDIHSRVNTYMGVTPGQSGYNILVEEKKPGDPDASYVTCQIPNNPPGTSIACAGNVIRVTVSAPFKFVMPVLNGQAMTVSTDIKGTILRPSCITN